MTTVRLQEIPGWFNAKLAVRPLALFFTIVAVLFYAIWLKDVIPAIIDNTVPASVTDYDLLVNPVHILDLAIALPTLILTSVHLRKKTGWGLLLTPMLLIFLILLSIALVAMVLVVYLRNIAEDGSIAIVFAVVAVVGSVFLIHILRNLKKGDSFADKSTP